jgi:hypothetical protein
VPLQPKISGDKQDHDDDADNCEDVHLGRSNGLSSDCDPILAESRADAAGSEITQRSEMRRSTGLERPTARSSMRHAPVLQHPGVGRKTGFI